MSSTWSHTQNGGHDRDADEAEKGIYRSTQRMAAMPPLAYIDRKKLTHLETPLSPISPMHEGITPSSSVPVLSLSWPVKPQYTAVTTPVPAAEPKKISRWIIVQLWFNTYRKFFTFVTTLNALGITMASLGRFPYAENHLGALVLGNLLCAILMRNELFLRFLYTIAIYGLRGVCYHRSIALWLLMMHLLVGSSTRKASSNFGVAACWWYSFGMCTFWICVR